MEYCLAVDVGASSGRHIVGWREGDVVRTQEVYRFPNAMTTENGHLAWDLETLEENVRRGLDEARSAFPLTSLAVDTWGVDYVLMGGDRVLRPCCAYRDGRTAAAVEAVHKLVPFSELYRRTGCQFQPFNSIYQLYADRQAGRLERATDLLMLPEYLLYRLCGAKVREYTNATTTGLVSAETGEYDAALLDLLGLPRRLFPRLTRPGAVVGDCGGVRCVLCATHDTASAVEGIPMEGDELYISSGTWSLLGVKTPRPLTDEASERANYANEGGVGYNRYQKNIMGMWLVNELRRELCPETPMETVVAAAEESGFDGLVDVNDPVFLAPASMRAAFDGALGGGGRPAADYFRCAFRSLAAGYGRAVSELERSTGVSHRKIYIVGGGAKNALLNRLTAQATGKRVVALPIEATALGNLQCQFRTIMK